MVNPSFVGTFQYGKTVETALPFEPALERVKALLKEEGFGVLSEIDVAATLHEKIGEAFRPYRILGACNPQLAFKALTAEPQIGLLLPCNVVVQEVAGKTLVSAIDAHAMLGVVENATLEIVANDASTRLDRFLEKIATQVP